MLAGAASIWTTKRLLRVWSAPPVGHLHHVGASRSTGGMMRGDITQRAHGPGSKPLGSALHAPGGRRIMSRVMCRQDCRARRRERWLHGWRRRQGGHLVATGRAVYVPVFRRRLFGRRLRWPGHWTRRQTKQQRKTGTYSALPVATRWAPLRRRHPWSHLSRRRARPSCRHMMNNMIISQPGAWSAEPSGLLPGPWNFGSLTRNIMTLVLREARKSWRCPTGGADHTRSSLLMV